MDYITFLGKVTHVHLIKHDEMGARCAIIFDMEKVSFFPTSCKMLGIHIPGFVWNEPLVTGVGWRCLNVISRPTSSMYLQLSMSHMMNTIAHAYQVCNLSSLKMKELFFHLQEVTTFFNAY